VKLFVPGRVCLLGEHSDWAGSYRASRPDLEKGYAIVAGTDQGIHAEVDAHPFSLVLHAAQSAGHHPASREIPMEAGPLLREARAGGYWSYVAGVAYQALLRHGTGGLAIRTDCCDLPVKKGLSSSAAICVLAARAFNRLYGLGLDIRQEMELAYQGEVATPSRCGRMDQGCAFGDRVVLMTFDGDRLETEELEVGGDLYLLLVDLQAGKDTIHILDRLHRAYPRAGTAVHRGVQELLGPVNRRIVREAREALGAGDAPRLGALMTESQAAFDRYAAPACPEELTAPVLHRLLGHEPLREFTWGGKGIGSQGDGSAQLVARGPEARLHAIEVIRRDLGMPCLELTIRSQSPGDTPGPGPAEPGSSR
jgi:galactokinase